MVLYIIIIFIMKNIQVLGLLHFIGSFFVSFGGILFPLIYYIVYKDKLTKKDITVFHDIMNFQISYLLFLLLSLILVFVVVGIVGLVIFGIMYLVNIIIGVISHLNNKRYKYMLVFHFFK